MFSSKNCWNFCFFWMWIAKMQWNELVKLVKFCFTSLHSSVFGKVRELVGEIKFSLAGYWVIRCRWFNYTHPTIWNNPTSKFLHRNLQNWYNKACMKIVLLEILLKMETIWGSTHIILVSQNKNKSGRAFTLWLDYRFHNRAP